MRRSFCLSLALIFCTALLLSGCSFFSFSEKNKPNMPPTNENQFSYVVGGDGTISPGLNQYQTTVFTEAAPIYDAPCGNQVGTISAGVSVSFSYHEIHNDTIWVKLTDPFAGSWMALDNLAGAERLREIILSGGIQSDTEYTYSGDDNPYNDSFGGNQGENQGENQGGQNPGISSEGEKFLGHWVFLGYDPNFPPPVPAFQMTFTICENGYAICQTSSGEYYDGYTPYVFDETAFGTWSYEDSTFTFYCMEDLLHHNDYSVGHTSYYSVTFTEDGFQFLTDQNLYDFTPAEDTNGMMDLVYETAAKWDGVEPGQSPTNSGGLAPGNATTQDIIGNWVWFATPNTRNECERAVYIFRPGNSCDILYGSVVNDGGWRVLYPNDGYYDTWYEVENGILKIDQGSYLAEMSVSVSGDTMTLYYEYDGGGSQTMTFTRFADGEEPMPE